MNTQLNDKKNARITSYKFKSFNKVIKENVEDANDVKKYEFSSLENVKQIVREKEKNLVDFISKNAIDPKTGNPHTADRIKSALEEARINIKNIPIENQIQDIIHAISGILPISMETRKIKVTIPSMHTGKAYGVVNQYKGEESWLGNGDLEVVVNIPAGIVMDFFDKLNSVTHGSALTEEIKE